MNKWRFRTNWRGKLILQRLTKWESDGFRYATWADASASDLLDYYYEIYQKDETS